MFITTFILCSTRITVRPAAMRRMRRMVSSVSSGLMPAVGSSRRRRVGSVESAMPSSRWRFSPCERWAARRSRLSHSPTSWSRRPAFSRTAVRAAARPQKLKARRYVCAATRTFSSTLRCGNTLVIWYDLATPRRDTRCCGRPVISRPSNQMRPELGGISPEMRRKKVVLPAPFGPMIERSSPRSTSKSTCVTARRLPKLRVRRSVRTMGDAMEDEPGRNIAGRFFECQGRIPRVKPAPFAYHRPTSLDEALALLARYGSDGRILAGGQSLVPALNMRLATPTALIDINRVHGLDGITVEGDALVMGALARHDALEHSALVARHAPLIALRGRPDLLGLGHSHIVGRLGWPA